LAPTASPTPPPTVLPTPVRWVVSDTSEGIKDYLEDLDNRHNATGADRWTQDPVFVHDHNLTSNNTIKHRAIECRVHRFHGWSKCDAECGGGRKMRLHADTNCPFDVIHIKCCNTHPCTPCALGSRHRFFKHDWQTCKRTWGPCEKCAKGTFQDVPNVTACKTCPGGTYTDVPGSLACTPWTQCCGGHKKTGANVTSNGACELCSAGRFKKGCGFLSQCHCCAAGRVGDVAVAAQDDEQHCRACPKGTFQPDECVHHEPSQPNKCQSCPSGYFQASEGSAACDTCSDACPAGTFEAAPCGG
jgi:hypothetical protein